ncbi:MAG: alpha-amylase [Pirellulaceae bacterium]|nr:alpha-amylase [Pirellulaceae bacterium]
MPHPTLFQINTRVWLTKLSRGLGRTATLDDIPDDELDRLAAIGIQWLWMLSVWQTGARGRQVSRSHPHWRSEFQSTLTDLQEADIAGSGFAITDYVVHQELGGPAALSRLRTRMAERGLRLMLDFVPNHTALDHVWLESHPEHFVTGTEEDLRRAPQNFTALEVAGQRLVLAHGRDPYFDGWPDTLQINYGNTSTQRAMQAELQRIAQQCDGVRCDMAMLILPEVFQRTWGITTEAFWPTAIQQVKDRWPDFCFLAEVYWDLEGQLQQQGFDYTYDKRLYDRLLADAGPNQPQMLHAHFRAEEVFQNKSARFLENHDERRIASALDIRKHQAAALLTYLSPGLRFFHQGQWEGHRQRISPHLIRAPDEPADPAISQFYQELHSVLNTPTLRNGQWQLLNCGPDHSGDKTWSNFIVFAWQGMLDDRLLVVVNYSPDRSRCLVRLPFTDLSDHDWMLTDQLSPAAHAWRGQDLTGGLYLEEPAWRAAAFKLEKVTQPRTLGGTDKAE